MGDRKEEIYERRPRDAQQVLHRRTENRDDTRPLGASHMNFFDWLKIVLLMSVILLALTIILHQKIQNAPKKDVKVEYRLMNINF